MQDCAGAETVLAVVDGREISGAQEIKMVAAHSQWQQNLRAGLR